MLDYFRYEDLYLLVKLRKIKRNRNIHFFLLINYLYLKKYHR